MDSFNTIGWNVIVITNKAKSPDRIFQLFDYLFSEEGTVIMYYGPKGFMYDDVDSNGIPYLKKQISDLSDDEKKQIGAFIWSFPGNSIAATHMSDAIQARLPEDQWDWTGLQEAKTVWPHSKSTTEFTPLLTDITLNDPNSDYNTIKSKFTDYNTDLIPKIITAKTAGDAQALLSRAVEDVDNMDFAKYSDYCTQLWQNK